MRRPTAFLLVLTALLLMLAMPVVAQEGTTTDHRRTLCQSRRDGTSGATDEPAATAGAHASRRLPTAIPSSDGPVVQGVFFFSPTCGHCEYVITQVLPGIFADNGGDHVITFDESVPPRSRPSTS